MTDQSGWVTTLNLPPEGSRVEFQLHGDAKAIRRGEFRDGCFHDGRLSSSGNSASRWRLASTPEPLTLPAGEELDMMVCKTAGILPLVTFKPSTNLICAFEAAEKCGLVDPVTVIYFNWANGKWYVDRGTDSRFGVVRKWVIEADTLPLAICRAVLKHCAEKGT